MTEEEYQKKFAHEVLDSIVSLSPCKIMEWSRKNPPPEVLRLAAFKKHADKLLEMLEACK